MASEWACPSNEDSHTHIRILNVKLHAPGSMIVEPGDEVSILMTREGALLANIGLYRIPYET